MHSLRYSFLSHHTSYSSSRSLSRSRSIRLSRTRCVPPTAPPLAKCNNFRVPGASNVSVALSCCLSASCRLQHPPNLRRSAHESRMCRIIKLVLTHPTCSVPPPPRTKSNALVSHLSLRSRNALDSILTVAGMPLTPEIGRQHISPASAATQHL